MAIIRHYINVLFTSVNHPIHKLNLFLTILVNSLTVKYINHHHTKSSHLSAIFFAFFA